MPHPKVRLFVTQPLHPGATIAFGGKQAHYLLHVMRCEEGESVAVFNGKDGEWIGTLERRGKRDAALKLQRQTRPYAPCPDIWLLFAPIKSGPMEYLAQKATELGVRKLIPVKTEHTAVGRVNGERLYANAIEAAEQTERLDVPAVESMQPLMQLLAAWPSDRVLIFCDETGKAEDPRIVLSQWMEPPHPNLLPFGEKGFDRANGEMLLPLPEGERVGVRGSQKLALLIGPEGGFSQRELEHLRSLPFARAMHLGPRVLRADTAAVAGLTCLQVFLGDWTTPPSFRTNAS